MADIATNIVVKLINGITDPLKRITSDFDSFRAGMKRSEVAFDWSMKLNQSAEAAGRLADKIKSLTEEPIKFAESAEVSFAGLQRRTGLAGEAFEKLKDRVTAVAAGTDWDTSHTTQGLTLLMKRGFETEEAFRAMPAILNLAEGASMDLGQATELTAGVMKRFGATSGETEKYTDVLTKAASMSGFSVAELGGSLESVAKNAKFFGMSFETTAGLMAAFSKSAGSTETASAALNTVFDHLASPRGAMMVGKGLKYLYGEGVNVKDKLRDIPALFVDVTEKTKNLDAAMRGRVFRAIFGTTDIAQMVQMTGPGGIGAAVDQMNKARGASAKAAEIMGGTASQATERYEASIKRLQSTLGEALLPGITRTMNALAGFVDGVTRWSSEHKTLTTVLMRSVQIIGAVAGAIALAINALAGLAAVVGVINIALGTNLTVAIAVKAIPAIMAWIFTTGVSAVAAAGSFAASIVTTAIPALGALIARLAVAAVGSLAVVAPFLAIAAAIGAVSLAIGELVKNWKNLDFLEAAKGMVDWVKDNGALSAVGTLFDPSALINDVRGMASPMASALPTLQGAAGAPGASGGGRLDIHVTADGQPKVTRAEPDGGMPWAVNTGLGMATP